MSSPATKQDIQLVLDRIDNLERSIRLSAKIGKRLLLPIKNAKLDGHEPEIKQLLADGSTLKSIAQRYGVSEPHVSLWLKKNGIHRPKRKINKLDRHEVEIKKLLAQGIALSRVAKLFETYPSAIKQWAVDRGISLAENYYSRGPKPVRAAAA